MSLGWMLLLQIHDQTHKLPVLKCIDFSTSSLFFYFFLMFRWSVVLSNLLLRDYGYKYGSLPQANLIPNNIVVFLLLQFPLFTFYYFDNINSCENTDLLGRRMKNRFS